MDRIHVGRSMCARDCRCGVEGEGDRIHALLDPASDRGTQVSKNCGKFAFKHGQILSVVVMVSHTDFKPSKDREGFESSLMFNVFTFLMTLGRRSNCSGKISNF